MNLNLAIKRHEKKLERLNLKFHNLEQSIRLIRKSLDKMNKPERRISTRRLTLMERLEADDRLKNLMMPDFTHSS